MSISVVIPTYNRRSLLERALASVYAQTRLAEEVIVVDDGSNDQTAEMVLDRFPQVRLLRQANCGVSSARNLGIQESSGEWIALLDSDDEWLPAKLEHQMQALAESPEYDLCHCNELWLRRGVRVNQGRRHAKSGGWIFQMCLPRCVISPSAAVIRRAMLNEIGLFDVDLPACEDYDLWLRFCSRRPVLFVDEALVVKHGGRADQLSRLVEGLDQYRVRSIAALLDSAELGQEDEIVARRVMREKAMIFAAGARKRGRDSLADEILAMAGASKPSGVELR